MAVTQPPAAAQPAHKSTELKAAASLSPTQAQSTSTSATDTSSSSGASSRSNSSAKDKAEDEAKPTAKEPTHADAKEPARKTSKARSDGSRSNSRRSSLGVDRSSRPHYKEGIRLAEMGKWTTLMERVASEPQLARHKDHHGMLPLHWACTEDDVPTSAVRALLAAFPEAVITKNNAQYLPLHIAVKARASLATLRLLVEARPSSLLEETPSGKTVLQLAAELQLPAGSMQLLKRAEQDYQDLSEDDDEAFDYEDAKRQIAVQSQLLRESMLHPPSMAGPNASLGNGISAPITDVDDDEDQEQDDNNGDTATSDSMFESQGMITSLSFVGGALVQSQSISSNAAVAQQDGDVNASSVPAGKDQRKGSGQAPSRSKSHQETSAKATSAPVEPQNEASAPATGPGRSKSQSKSRSKSNPKATAGPALRTTGLDESTFGQAIYEEQHNAGVCGVCYKKFSMFRKKYQCKGCFTYLCKKHVAGKLELPNYYKKRSVCGDCYRIYRNGPMPGPASTTKSGRHARNSASMSTSTTTNGAGGNVMASLQASPSLPLPPPPSSADSSKPDTLERTISNGSSLMVSGNSRSSSLMGNNMNGVRAKRAESTHSMVGRPSNMQGPQLNARYSTNALGAPHPIRTQAGALVRGISSNTMLSDTTMSISEPENERQAAEVDALQHRVATLEECNKILMNRVADQEKQYNEAMLLLTTTMTRVAEMEIRMPTSEQRKSLRGTGGSTTASERASELDTDMSKFSFPTPYVEKYD